MMFNYVSVSRLEFSCVDKNKQLLLGEIIIIQRVCDIYF